MKISLPSIPGTDATSDSTGDSLIAHPSDNGRFKLADKRGPLVDLGKHLGLFKERVEHTGKDDGPIEVKQYSDIEAARLIGRLLKKVDGANPGQTDPPKEAGDEAAVSTPEGRT